MKVHFDNDMDSKKSFMDRLRKALVYIKVYFQLQLDGIRLDLAIFMANALQRAKNKRFYVIENAQGKLIWLCNDDIKAMKKPRTIRKYVGGKFRTFKFRMMPKNVTHLDIMRDCLYYTDVRRNDNTRLTEEQRRVKRIAWLNYLEQRRMDRMFGKLKAKK